jgi:hypothetical protein
MRCSLLKRAGSDIAWSGGALTGGRLRPKPKPRSAFGIRADWVVCRRFCAFPTAQAVIDRAGQWAVGPASIGSLRGWPFDWALT